MTDPVVPVDGGVPVDPQTGERFGYLPRKAARRKLVIRRQLQLRWVVAAVVVATLIAGTGGWYLASRATAPGPPYVDQGPLQRYPPGALTPLGDGAGWLDRRGGGLVAVGCGPTGPSRWPARVTRGRVYVDPTRPAPLSRPAGPFPPCRMAP